MVSVSKRHAAAKRKAYNATRAHTLSRRSWLWRGPKGECECCDERVEVWIASTLQQPDARPWIASEDFLTNLYGALLSRVKDDTTDGEWTLYVRCKEALVGDRHRKRLAKVYFADIGGLVGPYCQPCVKDFLRKWERMDGSQDDVKIYVVNTSHGALRRVLHSKINKRDTIDLADDELMRDLY